MAWALDNIEGLVLVLLIIIKVVGCFFFFNLYGLRIFLNIYG